MKKTKLYIAILLPMLLTACFGKNTVKVEEVKKVKSVAVIMYTVPEQISYRDDARDGSKGLLAALAESAIGNTGGQAANTAVKTFTETLQKQDLSFNVMSHSDVVSNKGFIALYEPVSKIKKEVDESLLGKSLSFLGSMAGEKSVVGVAPKNMNQYGLAANWNGDTALTNKKGESDYINKAIEALKVDAVLVVNDTGFSFSCEACVGVGGAMNGVASTGSAFNATLVSRSGSIMNIREWFATTDEQGAMVAGVVDPTEHEELFAEHGRKMAIVFADAVKETLTAK